MPEGSVSFAVVPRDPTRWVSGPITVAGLCLAAGAVVRFSGLDHAGVSFCYFKVLTGKPCLTCGTTRAFGHLARFDVGAALAVQPLVALGFIALVGWGALDAVLLTSSRRSRVEVHGTTAPRVLFAAGLALAILNWMYLLATGV